MKNIWTVVRHEIITTLTKPSFWFTTIVFPALVMVLSLGNSVIGAQAIEESATAAREMALEVSSTFIGYVDLAGIIKTIPPEIPAGLLKSYPTEEAAQADLEAGILRQYYIVPGDFLVKGEVILVDKDYQPLMSESGADFFKGILITNLSDQSAKGLVLYNPTPSIINHPVAPQDRPLDQGSASATMIPLAVMFILFFVITNSASFMLQSVSKEKENRTAELLLTSLRPRDLMLGKVLGLGVVALVQMGVWMSGSIFALDRSAGLLQTAKAFELPAGFIPLALIYFLLGFFVYGAAMGAVGVLAPNSREAGQFTFLVILPLIVPLTFNFVFTEDPHGLLATVFSIFPLTAPASMLSRLVHGGVPAWQIIVSLVGLALTAYLFVALAARLFRADTFLSSSSLTWKRLWTELRNRPTA